MNREDGLGSHSLTHFPQCLINHTVSVDVKHHERRMKTFQDENFTAAFMSRIFHLVFTLRSNDLAAVE